GSPFDMAIIPVATAVAVLEQFHAAIVLQAIMLRQGAFNIVGMNKFDKATTDDFGATVAKYLFLFLVDAQEVTLVIGNTEKVKIGVEKGFHFLALCLHGA